MLAGGRPRVLPFDDGTHVNADEEPIDGHAASVAAPPLADWRAQACC